MTLQTEVPEALMLDCGNLVHLQRITQQDFIIYYGGERAGLIRLGSGLPCEIGFEVVEKYRRRGVATAAVRTITDAVFDAGHIDRIAARVQKDNAASIRVLTKAGFKYGWTTKYGETWMKSKA